MRRALPALALFLVAAGCANSPHPEAPPSAPTTTVGTAATCATGTLVDCSAACGKLASMIRWRFDEAERRALEEQYQRDCSQFGPPYSTLGP